MPILVIAAVAAFFFARSHGYLSSLFPASTSSASSTPATAVHSGLRTRNGIIAFRGFRAASTGNHTSTATPAPWASGEVIAGVFGGPSFTLKNPDAGQGQGGGQSSGGGDSSSSSSSSAPPSGGGTTTSATDPTTTEYIGGGGTAGGRGRIATL